MAIEKRYEVSYLFRRVLVPVDGSENSFRALELALDFAIRYGSRVDVLCVVEEGSEMCSDVRKEAIERASRRGAPINFIIKNYNPRNSSVSTEIVKTIVEEGYDAVVIGARGRSIYGELNLGSTALSIAINSPSTIIIVR